MSFAWSLLVAIGLCFDTFAVSVSSGIICHTIKFRTAVKFAFILAFFQGLMPVLGWVAGNELSPVLTEYDHWIAFGLLFIIGLRMIFSSGHESGKNKFDPLKLSSIIFIAIATSIDALALGFSFAFAHFDIIITSVLIGIVTFLASMLGLLIGKKTTGKYNKKLEIFGGLILIGIGIRILVEHL